MSLYRKLKLLVRASAEEPARKLVEHHDIRIFEQEIADAERSVKAAKLHLANVKAEVKSLTRSIDDLKIKLETREKQTIEAMDKDQELARELAQLIAEDEVILQQQEKQLQHLRKVEEKLLVDLKQAVRAIQGHVRQVQILKANQHSMQGSQGLISNSQTLNGTLRDLNESLSGIKQRQLRASYLDEAEGDVEDLLSGDDIERRLAASGIQSGQHDADAVLDRLKLKHSA